jgi:hypothetical protein
MKYIGDSMLYGMGETVCKEGFDFATAPLAIRGHEDKGDQVPDAEIFHFVFDKMFEQIPKPGAEPYTIVTCDYRLMQYCQFFGISFIFIDQHDLQQDFQAATVKLIEELKQKRSETGS